MLFNEFVNGKALIEKAKEFATECHKKQTRKFSGEPYIVHPEAVASLVQQYGGTPEMIAVGWLHDVKEDCGVKSLKDEFGEKVDSLVDELTNPENINRGGNKAEYIAKKMTTMSSDALTIKLCDRLNNVSDFKTSKPSFVQKYAPATRLILNELEDSGRPLDVQQTKLVAEIDKAITPYENPKQ